MLGKAAPIQCWWFVRADGESKFRIMLSNIEGDPATSTHSISGARRKIVRLISTRVDGHPYSTRRGSAGTGHSSTMARVSSYLRRGCVTLFRDTAARSRLIYRRVGGCEPSHTCVSWRLVSYLMMAMRPSSSVPRGVIYSSMSSSWMRPVPRGVIYSS